MRLVSTCESGARDSRVHFSRRCTRACATRALLEILQRVPNPLSTAVRRDATCPAYFQRLKLASASGSRKPASITKRQTFNILSIGTSAHGRSMAPVLIIPHYSKTMGISYPFVKNDVKRTSGISACCCCCCFESEPLGRGNENKSVYYRGSPCLYRRRSKSSNNGGNESK